MRKKFKKMADQVLRQCGLTFTGIHLHCRCCGDEAFAADTKMATTFGWSHLQHIQGAKYQGFCMTCSHHQPDMKSF